MVTDYAGQLLRQNRDEDAVAAAHEAIELFRAAGAEAPEEFTRYRAFALRNLTMGLRALGRTDEALNAAQRAVNVARHLARRKPDQAGILVDNLCGLAQTYRMLGRTADAVAAARESVDVARALADALPRAGHKDLGRALTQLAKTLSWADLLTDAVLVATEAVAAWRTVAKAHPNYLSELSLALARHAFLQRQIGDVLTIAHRQRDAPDAALAAHDDDATAPGETSTTDQPEPTDSSGVQEQA